jgi:hypothetical protein
MGSGARELIRQEPRAPAEDRTVLRSLYEQLLRYGSTVTVIAFDFTTPSSIFREMGCET